MHRQIIILRKLALIAYIYLVCAPIFDIPHSVAAGQTDQSFKIDISAKPIRAAFAELAQQSNIEITVLESVPGQLVTPAVSGQMTPLQAAQRLLADSGVEIVNTTSSNLTIGAGRQIRKSAEENSNRSLSAVIVTTTPDSTTERTGSYATRVVSAATQMNLSLRQTPQRISVITNKQIQDQSLKTFDDIMINTPGITTWRRDERVSYFSSGFELNQMIDGIPTSTYATSQASERSMIGSILYDRVEVIRGAAGLLNGIGDPGGAVNLVRKRPGLDFSGNISFGAGSWNRYNSDVDFGGPIGNSEKLRARIVGSLTNGDDFIEYKKRRDEVLYGIVEADLSERTTMSLGIERHRTAIRGANFGELPLFYDNGTRTDLDRSFNNAAPWSYISFMTNRYFLNIMHDLGRGWQLKAEASYTESRRHMNGAWADAYGTASTATDEIPFGGYAFVPTKASTKSIAAYASGPFSFLSRTHQANLGFYMAGLRHRQQSFGVSDVPNRIDRDAIRFLPQLPTDTLAADFGNETRETAVYGSTRLQLLDSIAAILGGRFTWYENVPVRNDGRDPGGPQKESRVFTPYAGLVYDISSNYSAYASWTDIFAPNSVLDANDVVLDPRRGINKEIGIKGEHFGGKLNTNVAIFDTVQDNLAVVDTEAGPRPDGTFPSKAVQGARSKGFEISVAGEVADRLNVMGGFTQYSQRNAQGGLLLTMMPRRSFKIVVGYRLPRRWHYLSIGGSVNYIGKTYFDYELGPEPLRAEQGGATVFGLFGEWRFNDKVSASLVVDNITGKSYYSMAGYYGYTYHRPRNAWVRVRYQF